MKGRRNLSKHSSGSGSTNSIRSKFQQWRLGRQSDQSRSNTIPDDHRPRRQTSRDQFLDRTVEEQITKEPIVVSGGLQGVAESTQHDAKANSGSDFAINPIGPYRTIATTADGSTSSVSQAPTQDASPMPAKWKEACERYRELTGREPSVTGITDVDALLATLNNSESKFTEVGERHERLRSALNRTSRYVRCGLTLAKSVAGNGLSYAGIIFEAVRNLLEIADDTGKKFDSIQNLFDTLRSHVLCVTIYSRGEISKDLSEVFGKKMCCILVVIGIATKMLTDGRIVTFFKGVLQGMDHDGLHDLLEELKSLSDDEVRIALAGQHVMLRTLMNSLPSNTANTRLGDLKKKLRPDLDVQKFFDTTLAQLVENTCMWILDHDRFLSWLDWSTNSTQNSALWVSGGPGAGKTSLAARIVDCVQTSATPSDVRVSASVAYFFARADASGTHNVDAILRTVAYQIARTNLAYCAYLEKLLEDDGNERRGIEKTFQLYFSDFFNRPDFPGVASIIIDGVDEIWTADNSDNGDLRRLLKSVQLFLSHSTASGARSRLRFIFLGRPTIDELMDELLPNSLWWIILGDQTTADVERFISARLMLQRFAVRFSDHPHIQRKIRETLSGKSFLWVKLVFEELARCKSEPAADRALRDFPAGVQDAIGRVLALFSKTETPTDIEILNEILSWVACAYEQVTLTVIQEIICRILPGMGSLFDLEGVLRTRWSVFFTLIRGDGLTTEQLRESKPASQKYSSDPATTSVTISHIAFLEYFRQGEARELGSAGITVKGGHFNVSLSCLKIIGEHDSGSPSVVSESREVVQPPIRFYPPSRAMGLKRLLFGVDPPCWLGHLDACDPDTLSFEQKTELASLVKKAFSEPRVFRSWFGQDRVSFTQLFIEDSRYPDILAKLLLAQLVCDSHQQLKIPLEWRHWDPVDYALLFPGFKYHLLGLARSQVGNARELAYLLAKGLVLYSKWVHRDRTAAESSARVPSSVQLADHDLWRLGVASWTTHGVVLFENAIALDRVEPLFTADVPSILADESFWLKLSSLEDELNLEAQVSWLRTRFRMRSSGSSRITDGCKETLY